MSPRRRARRLIMFRWSLAAGNNGSVFLCMRSWFQNAWLDIEKLWSHGKQNQSCLSDPCSALSQSSELSRVENLPQSHYSLHRIYPNMLGALPHSLISRHLLVWYDLADFRCIQPMLSKRPSPIFWHDDNRYFRKTRRHCHRQADLWNLPFSHFELGAFRTLIFHTVMWPLSIWMQIGMAICPADILRHQSSISHIPILPMQRHTTSTVDCPFWRYILSLMEDASCRPKGITVLLPCVSDVLSN